MGATATLEVTAAVVSAVAWLLVPILCLQHLPLTKAVRWTGTALFVCAALTSLAPLGGKRLAGAAAAVHLAGGIALLAFVVALAGAFKLAADRRRLPVDVPPADRGRP